MYFDRFIALSDSMHNKLMQILTTKHGTLSNNKDKTNLVKFYCALQEFGHQILKWEVETFEIVLGRKGFGYDEIMDTVGMVFTAEHFDYVCSNRDHFENAVQLLNDLTLDTSTTELQPPHYIMWAICGLITLYHTKNIPIIGDAANYIGESFKEYGWTQPPVFFIGRPLQNVFPEPNEEYIKILKQMSFDEFAQASVSIKEPQNGFENYLKLHAPIIVYMDDMFKKVNEQTQEILKIG